MNHFYPLFATSQSLKSLHLHIQDLAFSMSLPVQKSQLEWFVTNQSQITALNGTFFNQLHKIVITEQCPNGASDLEIILQNYPHLTELECTFLGRFNVPSFLSGIKTLADRYLHVQITILFESRCPLIHNEHVSPFHTWTYEIKQEKIRLMNGVN